MKPNNNYIRILLFACYEIWCFSKIKLVNNSTLNVNTEVYHNCGF